MRRNKGGLARTLCGVLAFAFVLPLAHAAKGNDSTAKLSVDGVGLLRDRELRAALTRLLGTELKATLDANAIEDAAVILASSISEQGFQRPEITIEMNLEDGTEKRLVF